MITLFKNEEKGTYFFADPKSKTLNHVKPNEVSVFFRYQNYFDLKILTLPDYKTVCDFKKLISKDLLKDVPLDQIGTFIYNNYPEYFL